MENLERLKEFFENKSDDELIDVLNKAKGNYEDAIQILLEF